MRISVEEIVEKAVLNEKLDAEKRVKALMLDYNYEQIRSYEPYSNTIVITDAYHIPVELLEKCYGKSRKEILDMLI